MEGSLPPSFKDISFPYLSSLNSHDLLQLHVLNHNNWYLHIFKSLLNQTTPTLRFVVSPAPGWLLSLNLQAVVDGALSASTTHRTCVFPCHYYCLFAKFNIHMYLLRYNYLDTGYVYIIPIFLLLEELLILIILNNVKPLFHYHE